MGFASLHIVVPTIIFEWTLLKTKKFPRDKDIPQTRLYASSHREIFLYEYLNENGKESKLITGL